MTTTTTMTMTNMREKRSSARIGDCKRKSYLQTNVQILCGVFAILLTSVRSFQSTTFGTLPSTSLDFSRSSNAVRHDPSNTFELRLLQADIVATIDGEVRQERDDSVSNATTAAAAAAEERNDENEDATAERKDATRMAVSRGLLGKRTGVDRRIKRRARTSTGPIKDKGARRTNSAVGKVFSAVARTAAAAASGQEAPMNQDPSPEDDRRIDRDEKYNLNDDDASSKRKTKAALKVERANKVKSTIRNMLLRQEDTRNSASIAPAPFDPLPGPGLFGPSPQTTAIPEPRPRTVLLPSTVPFLPSSSSSSSSFVRDSVLTAPSDVAAAVSVRVADCSDDADIAELRLSVFSNNPHHDRRRFRVRSRQVLEARRSRGAVCLVATLPSVFRGDLVARSRNRQRRPDEQDRTPLRWERWGDTWSSLDDEQREEEWTAGSAECSVHEFYGTLLGRQRRFERVLYVTEVAVNPNARMLGIGRKLLEAVDELARVRDVESLYLHVDVTNTAAIRLYTNIGYTIVEPTPAHREFTESLNLHDGAGNGRSHFLLVKHLKEPTLHLDGVGGVGREDERRKEIEFVGFEIPT